MNTKTIEFCHASAMLAHNCSEPHIWEPLYKLATEERQEGFVELLRHIADLALAFERAYQKRFEDGAEIEWLESLENLTQLVPAYYADHWAAGDLVAACFDDVMVSGRTFFIEPKRQSDGEVETCPEDQAEFWGVYYKDSDSLTMHLQDFPRKGQCQSFANLLNSVTLAS